MTYRSFCTNAPWGSLNSAKAFSGPTDCINATPFCTMATASAAVPLSAAAAAKARVNAAAPRVSCLSLNRFFIERSLLCERQTLPTSAITGSFGDQLCQVKQPVGQYHTVACREIDNLKKATGTCMQVPMPVARSARAALSVAPETP